MSARGPRDPASRPAQVRASAETVVPALPGDDATLASQAGEDDTLASFDGESPVAAPASVRIRPGAPARAPLDPARYAVTGELARGGMGRVSVALDLALGRTVAIKEMLGAAPELLARFERELTLTARLAHPGIVTVHDGGTWPDGAPVYVMRLVAGESLDRKLAGAPTLPARLALLPHAIAATDALAYAHAQGIIHRDLKPSNVMLGDFGETVVIDWGLAKDLRATPTAPVGPVRAALAPRAAAGAGTASAETVAGDVLGTPAYMPPEQARGDDVDERADVYALGALLYHLLAGAPPYQGAAAVALASVLDGPPPPLAARAPDAPPDLVTIVERAMAREPAGRYRTAAELSTDLKRFQRGKLVASHQYSTWELVRRWARKHRVLLAAIGSAAAVAVVVGTLSVRRVVREQAETRRALALAERHRGEAEAREAETAKLVDYLVFELHDRLRPVGRLDILASVASTLGAHYAARGETRDPAELRTRLRARRNVGEILRRKGDNTAALVEFRAAADLAATLAATAPDDPGLAAERLVIDAFMGDVLADQGDVDGALGVLVRARVRGQAARARAPEDPVLAAAVVEVLVSLGNTHDDRRENVVGQAAYLEAAEVARAAVAIAPTAPAQRRLAATLLQVGAAAEARRLFPAAADAYREALTLLRALADAAPDDAVVAFELQEAYLREGRVLVKQGDAPGGLARFQQARRIIEKLVARDPDNATWARDLSSIMVSIADALSEPATAEQAIAALREALPLRVRLAQRDPNNVTWQRDLIVVKVKLAMLTEAVGRTAEALALYQEAWEIGARLLAMPGEHAQLRRDLNNVCAGLGRIELERGKVDEALDWMRRAAETAEQLIAQRPADLLPGDYWMLVLARQDLGGALLDAGDRAGARVQLEAALEVATRRITEDPGDPDWLTKRDDLTRKLALVR